MDFLRLYHANSSGVAVSKLSGTLPHEVPSEADEAVQKVGAAASSAGRLLLAGARQVAAKQIRGLPTSWINPNRVGTGRGLPPLLSQARTRLRWRAR